MATAPTAPTDEIDVFISYSQKDRAIAEEVERRLRDLGVKTWRDPELTKDSHKSFIDTINRAHKNAGRVLVLWSGHSVESRWVKEEAEAAANQDRLVAVSLVPFHEVEIPIGFRCLPTATLAQIQADVELLRTIVSRDTDLHQVPELRKPNTGLPSPKLNIKELPATYTSTLYGRAEELAFLIASLDAADTRIVAYDAMGGTGKTALLFRFVQRLVLTDWRGLESVFTWSFYSQGSSEDKQSHAADFFKAAFAHFHPDGVAGMPEDPRQQGADLADLINQQATLLILDGLEPLQYAAGGHTGSRLVGGIKDPGLKTLLLRLAKLRKAGLTVITTRIELHELEDHATFKRRALEQLPTDAAIDLLRDRGIEKKAFPDTLTPAVRQEFVKTITDLKHHALSLNLAARLVAEHHEGQIRAFADVIPALHDAADQDIHENHRSPFRVMRALEAGLFRVLHNRLQRMSAAEAIDDSPAANQLCLLYFLGLFDRPASLEHLPVVYDATPDLRDAVPMLPEDKAEYLRKVAEAASIRDAVLHDPHRTDDARLEARHAFEDKFYDLSFHYWLPPVFARFDPRPQSNNRRVTNALTQLSQQNLVSQARLKTGEGGHVEWETLPPKEWFTHHVDCHPLIREYFGHQLRKKYPEAFQAAHGRLYDWFRFEGLPEEFRDPVVYGAVALKAAYPDHADRALRQLIDGTLRKEEAQHLAPSLVNGSVECIRSAQSLLKTHAAETALKRFLPTTEAGMTPLFSAIGHGCLAGRHHESFREVYWPRIARGNEMFALKKLGLFGQNLAALASFFETPFATPHPGVQASDQALVLNLAGSALRAIGRLPDAVEPTRAAAELPIQTQEWQRAASGHGNLSELLLTLGHVERDEAGQPGALPTAARAVDFADQSGDLFMRMVARASNHANALLAAGRLREAEERFREAEALQRQRQPGLPRLYSLQGFLYGDLLLARGRAEEVLERVATSLPMAQQHEFLLDIGLDQLNAARAQSRLASSQPSTKNQEPRTKNQEPNPRSSTRCSTPTRSTTSRAATSPKRRSG